MERSIWDLFHFWAFPQWLNTGLHTEMKIPLKLAKHVPALLPFRRHWNYKELCKTLTVSPVFRGLAVKTTEPCHSCPGCWSWQRGERVRGHVTSLGWKSIVLRLFPVWQNQWFDLPCKRIWITRQTSSKKNRDWKTWIKRGSQKSDSPTEPCSNSYFVNSLSF